jgi:hypothetical protein
MSKKIIGAIIFDFQISTKNSKIFILNQELLDFPLNNLLQKRSRIPVLWWKFRYLILRIKHFNRLPYSFLRCCWFKSKPFFKF